MSSPTAHVFGTQHVNFKLRVVGKAFS